MDSDQNFILKKTNSKSPDDDKWCPEIENETIALDELKVRDEQQQWQKVSGYHMLPERETMRRAENESSKPVFVLNRLFSIETFTKEEIEAIGKIKNA
jgi:hypothetical protein